MSNIEHVSEAVLLSMQAETESPEQKNLVSTTEGVGALETSRILGLDIGDRRVGIAISGPAGSPFAMTAQPLLTLVRSSLKHDLKSIGRILRKHGVAEIVAGNPLHMSGDQSPQAAKAQSFAAAVQQEFGLPMHLWDERLTTTEAHRQLDTLGHEKIGRKGIIDQVAAVLILQAYLDRRSLQSGPAAQATYDDQEQPPGPAARSSV